MNSHLGRYLEQVQRRWWVVLLAIAVVVFATAMMSEDRPRYVGKALLVQSSPGQSPEQDATMAVGYSTLFNEPATVGRLRAMAKLPEAVTFTASTVAASPILIIEATADKPGIAQDAAQRMAEVFRADINSARHAGYVSEIRDAERQLESAQAKPQPDGSINPLVPVLQARLDAMRSEGTNHLQDLQLRAGVTKSEPKTAFQLLSGAVGGLFLGVLAALGLAGVSRRIVNADDLLHKGGIEPLIVVPDRGSVEANRLREERLRILANFVSVQDPPKSSVLALADCSGAHGARELAEELAGLSAQQGRRTVLVYADHGTSESAHHLGFNDVLANSSLVNDVLRDGELRTLRILPAGSIVADRYPLMSRERIDAVLDELRVDNDHIVIAAPSMAKGIDSYPICAAADFTILVVRTRSSRSGDVTSAAGALADAHAVLLGAVLTGRGPRGRNSLMPAPRHSMIALGHPAAHGRER